VLQRNLLAGQDWGIKGDM